MTHLPTLGLVIVAFPKLVPFGHGYSHFMKGCVVDMFHFPMFSFDALGRHFEFLVIFLM